MSGVYGYIYFSANDTSMLMLSGEIYYLLFFLFVIIFSNKQSRTCTLREAVIVGSVLQEASVPPFDSRYNFMRNL